MIVCRIEHLKARCLQRGYALESAWACVVSQDGDLITVDETSHAYPHAKGHPSRGLTATNNCKPGDELKALLRDWLGIAPENECKCKSMAARMNMLGPEWCESDSGMAEIIGVMREEHARRRASGTTILPWSDFAAKRLVNLACRRARQKAGH